MKSIQIEPLANGNYGSRPLARFWRTWLMVVACTTFGFSNWLSNSLPAQQPPTSDSDILAEELLKDIVPNDAESADKQDTNSENASGPGRSFGAGENPFEVISLGMLTASKYLREGETGNTTQEVQNNVLMRLDELIEQSEKQSKKNKPSQSSSSSQRSTKRQTAEQKQQRQEANKQRSTQQNKSEGGQDSEDQGDQQRRSDQGENDETESGMPTGNGPQTSDGSRDGKADLGDAKALQQGVWGHLPERIRQQMMSRMVEKFLPEYEASIEEYFRKLSDSEEEPRKP